MLSLLSPDLESYVVRHSTPEPALLAELRTVTQRDLVDPQMQVGPVEGALLGLLIGLCGARRVLEIGTFSGYSALSMATALPEDGRLVTCDVDPEATAIARQFFDRSPHGHKIEIELGPAIATIERRAAAGERFDAVFIDADKESYADYWEAVLPLLPAGGLVIADNTLWSGTVVDPQRESDRAIVRFNARVASDERVDQVLLSVRDGVMLARKR
jgi:caffeoyl-CoA O-methyltransferase